MTSTYVSAISAFVATYIIVELVRRYGAKLRLVQVPNHRSSHVRPTPSGGGLGIALVGTVVALILGHASPIMFTVAIWASAIAAVIGLIDDRFDLSPRLRIIAQILIVTVLVLTSGISNILGAEGTAATSILIAVVVIVVGIWWINLFNFMDGIDGIAASEAIYILVAACTLFAATTGSGDNWSPLSSMIAVIAVCFGFLVHNLPPARIFMGDAGSYYLACFILAVALMTVATGTMRPAVWMILPAAFVADASVTLLRRFIQGDDWLSAHRQHAYQKLSRRWKGHLPSTLLYMAINVFWLYPLAFVANTHPIYEWLAVILAYIPLMVFCWAVGAGRMDAPTPSS